MLSCCVHFICILALTTGISVAAPSIHLSGVVTNCKRQTVSGASVVLKKSVLRNITDGKGAFLFTATSSRGNRTGMERSPSCLSLAYSRVRIHNPSAQNVVVTLYDLRGKVIGRVQDGFLSAGNHHFSLPRFSENSAVLVEARIGALRETIRMVGKTVHHKRIGTETADDVAMQSIVAARDTLEISHQIYSTERIVVPTDTIGLVVRLFGKLYVDRTFTMHVGDTLRDSGSDLMLSLDTIADTRCGCDVM